MGSTRTSHVLAAAGLAYPVLTVIGFVTFPQPPGGDVSPAHDPTWLASHTSTVIAQSYVRALAAVGFIVLAVAVGNAAAASARTRPLGQLACAGGTACGGLLLLSQAATLAAALGSRGHLDPAAVRSFDSANGALLSLSSLPAVLLFAGAGVAFLQDGHVPRWLTVLTLIGVPLALLDAASYDGGPFASVGLLGLAYFLVWALAAGLVLSRRGAGEPDPAPAGPVPAMRTL